MTDILREIGTIARALDSISNVEFKDLKLSKGQYLYLVRIYEQPGIILEELANCLKVDKTTASRAIKKLVANGLIERRTQLDNKKNKPLFVTKKGAQIYPTLRAEHNYSEQTALRHLTAKQQLQLQQLLQQVRSNIEKDWEIVKKGQKRNY